MALSETIKKLILNAWDDGYPCMLATVGKDGPNISAKGSMIVYDDQHLAYWERSKKKALENLGHDRRVVVMYANFKAQRDKVLEFGFPAVLGHRRAARVRPGHAAIFGKLLKREQEHVGADTGIGVLIKISRAADVRGQPIM